MVSESILQNGGPRGGGLLKLQQLGKIKSESGFYFQKIEVHDHVFLGIRRSTSFFRGHYRLTMLSLKWPFFIQLSFIKLIS